jgi:hypothetical protein
MSKKKMKKDKKQNAKKEEVKGLKKNFSDFLSPVPIFPDGLRPLCQQGRASLREAKRLRAVLVQVVAAVLLLKLSPHHLWLFVVVVVVKRAVRACVCVLCVYVHVCVRINHKHPRITSQTKQTQQEIRGLIKEMFIPSQNKCAILCCHLIECAIHNLPTAAAIYGIRTIMVYFEPLF